MKKLNYSIKKQKGQSVIELAALMPIIAVMVFLVFTAGWDIYTKIVSQNLVYSQSMLLYQTKGVVQEMSSVRFNPFSSTSANNQAGFSEDSKTNLAYMSSEILTVPGFSSASEFNGLSITVDMATFDLVKSAYYAGEGDLFINSQAPALANPWIECRGTNCHTQ